MATLVARSQSRSPSPPSSNDSPASSHSSPDTSDFHPTDTPTLHSPWKSLGSIGHPTRPNTKPTPVELWPASSLEYSSFNGVGEDNSLKVKSDDDREGAIFSEFIQEDAFDPTPLPAMSPQTSYNFSAMALDPLVVAHKPLPPPSFPSTAPSSHPYSLLAPQVPPVFYPQGINPQHSQSRTDLSASPASGSQAAEQFQRPVTEGVTVCPPKFSCRNLPIHVTNLPDRGAKSRVETQIKMDVELVFPLSPPGSADTTYKRVTSWKWLRLNKGATTKRRPKKDAKQESTSGETLYLSTEVICATPPNPKVHACSSCISREAKRIERKKATRIRPVRSDSEEEEAAAIPKIVSDQIKAEEDEIDDGSRIVLFNCPELVDFSSGSASLPVRITCYCRHHREKVGFRIMFTMRDNTGQVVGRGIAPPIMITDDHKSTQKSANAEDEEEEIDQTPAQQKRKRRSNRREEQDGDTPMEGQGEEEEEDPRSKRRTKPLPPRKPSTVGSTKSPAIRHGTASGRSSRRATPSRRSSPSATTPISFSASRTQPPAMSHPGQGQPSGPGVSSLPTSFDFNAMTTSSFEGSNQTFHAAATNHAEINAVLASLDNMNGVTQDGSGVLTSTIPLDDQQSLLHQSVSRSLSTYPQASASPSTIDTTPTSPLATANPLSSPGILDTSLGVLAGTLFSTNLFGPTMSPTATPSNLQAVSSPNPATQAPPSAVGPAGSPSLPPPVIHRLIPNSGPTHGGIDVTILGANFVPSLQCVFGDAVATSTQMWSENTIVCTLPPSPSPGPVVVWFRDVPMNMTTGNEMDGLLGLGPGPGLQWFTYLDNADRALMELALQVVGVKMTGRIEEAKSVAMRIVGTGSGLDLGASGSSGGAGGNQMGVQCSESPVVSRRGSSIDIASAAAQLTNPGRSKDFQSVIIDFLSLVDVELEDNTQAIPTSSAISSPNPTGQTLLHLAAILGFHRLVSFLITHGADVDARDKNGFTALHFAATCGRLACARILVTEGYADLEVVESRGRTARQLARASDQADVESLLTQMENRDLDVTPLGDEGEEDRDADASDSASAAEDDDSNVWMARVARHDAVAEARPPSNNASDSTAPRSEGHTRSGRVSRVHSTVPSRTASHAAFVIPRQVPRQPGSDLYSSDEGETPDPPKRALDPLPPLKDVKPLNEKAPSILDASSAWIQRTLAHLQPSQAMVPDLPWGLPNIQGIAAFPMQVPIPAWPAALQWQSSDGDKGRAYYDLAYWRAWYGGAAGGRWWSEKSPRQGDRPATPPPMYTPREEEVAVPVPLEEEPRPEEVEEHDAATPGASSSKTVVRAKLARRLGYDPGHVTDREVDAYAYYSRKMRKLKQDRMLVLFWLPILLIVIAWGLYETIPIALSTVKMTVGSRLPFRNPVNV
ncbi:SPT3 Dosage dependent suppressor of Ty-induced promoter mutations-like protein [Tulasnella sp. 403]|nr:SPT3 Dosage dependent suppressor of Ty-induced promoter mutations-like protein [Tulasnella sp. 403]